ncbi:MAG: aldose epimerase family protein [Actinomycetota bacterium]
MTLSSGGLEATFVPELNMLGTSLCLDGEEYLALPGGVAAYRRRHATGLPLLAPWANRLSERSYRSAGVRADLGNADLSTDPNGLPIHGTMWGETWQIESLSARGRAARLRVTFDYGREDLLAAFPFPHRIVAVIGVDGRSLSVSTSISPIDDRAVPVSFGFHPYLRLPRGRRSSWRLLLPEREHLELDDRSIPTGRRVREVAEREPIGSRTFDDLYALGNVRELGIEGGGRRLSVRFDDGYPFAQVYAPPDASFVCLEPMTAPTDALVKGDCISVQPGETFTARFTIRPDRTRSADAVVS